MGSFFDCVVDCADCLPNDNSTHVDDPATRSRRRWEQEREAEYGQSYASSVHSSGQQHPPRLCRSDTGPDTCGSSDSGFCGGDYNYYYHSHSSIFHNSANRYRSPTPPRERRTSRRQAGRAAAAAAAAAPRSSSSPPRLRPAYSRSPLPLPLPLPPLRLRLPLPPMTLAVAEAAVGAMKLSSFSAAGGITRSAAKPPFAGFFADSRARAGDDDGGAGRVSSAASIEAGMVAAAAAAAAAAMAMPLAAPSPSDAPAEDARQATAAELMESIASLLSARPVTAMRTAMQTRIDGDLRLLRSPLAATAECRSGQGSSGTDRVEHSGDSTQTMAVAVATPVAIPSRGTYGGDQLNGGGGGGQEEEDGRAAARRAATAAAFVAARNAFSSSSGDTDSSVSREGEEMTTSTEQEEEDRAVQARAIDVGRSLSWTTGAAAATAAGSPVLELPVLRTHARRPSQSSYGGSANEDGGGGSSSHKDNNTDLVYLSEVSDSDLSAILSASVLGSQCSGMHFHDAVFGSGDHNAITGGGGDVGACSPGGKVWAATTFPRENTKVAEDVRAAALAEDGVEEEDKAAGPAMLSSGTSTDTDPSVDRQRRGDGVSPADSVGSATTWRRDGDVLIRNRDKKDRASLNAIEAIASGAKCLETAPCNRDRDTAGEGVNSNQGLDLGQDGGSNGSGSPAKTCVMAHFRNLRLSTDGEEMIIITDHQEEDGTAVQQHHNFALADLLEVDKDLTGRTVTLVGRSAKICISFEGHASALRYFTEMLLGPSPPPPSPQARVLTSTSTSSVRAASECGGGEGPGLRLAVAVNEDDDDDGPIAHPERLIPTPAQSTTSTMASGRLSGRMSVKRSDSRCTAYSTTSTIGSVRLSGRYASLPVGSNDDPKSTLPTQSAFSSSSSAARSSGRDGRVATGLRLSQSSG
ncbi:unnamed protein product, partial [Ectocarpus fasciculatus]